MEYHNSSYTARHIHAKSSDCVESIRLKGVGVLCASVSMLFSVKATQAAATIIDTQYSAENAQIVVHKYCLFNKYYIALCAGITDQRIVIIRIECVSLCEFMRRTHIRL